ncbi:MAG: ABC transporter permease subunit [Angelakisella sp.]
MKKKYPKWMERVFWIVLLLAVWEVTVKVCKVSPLLFPSVEQVAATLWEGLTSGDLLYQSAYSLGIIGLGLLIALVLAFVLALLSVQYPVAGSLIDTITAIAHPLPGLALLPLIIMWFGTGSGAVLAIIVHSALWPMLLNLITGFESVPAIYLDTGRNLSMKPLAVTCEIMVRASAGYALSGIKIGWARAWRALISAEMAFGAVGLLGGIGWYILKQRTFMNTSGLFAGIVVVIILGILVEDVLFATVEKHTVQKWGMSSKN